MNLEGGIISRVEQTYVSVQKWERRATSVLEYPVGLRAQPWSSQHGSVFEPKAI